MKSIKLAIAALGIGLGTVCAYADVVQVNPGSYPADKGGEEIGPYTGLFDGLPATIFCDDADHFINPGPPPTSVNVSTINNLSLTRYGGSMAATKLSAVADYEQIFYLSTFLEQSSLAGYKAPVGYTNDGQSVQADIQDAIWKYYEVTTQVPQGVAGNVAYWQNQAAANYKNYSYNNFEILTDSKNQYGGIQELFINTATSLTTLSSTPEPGTLAMMFGAGLIAAVAVKRRRSSVL